MAGAGVLEILASAVGFGFVCYGVVLVGCRIGAALRTVIDAAFGAQMRAQFGEAPAVPVPDDVQILREKAAL